MYPETGSKELNPERFVNIFVKAKTVTKSALLSPSTNNLFMSWNLLLRPGSSCAIKSSMLNCDMGIFSLNHGQDVRAT